MVKKRKIETILIIEDEVEVRNFASRVLELEGYHILQAKDSEKGLMLVKGVPVSLVLLDLRLPEHNGWEVLEQIKSEPELMEIPVIVFTASAGVLQREKALEIGATDYLIKPLSAARLGETVARVLSREK